MTLKIIKVGTSLALVIPKDIARKNNLAAGMHMDLQAKEGELIYKKEAGTKMTQKGDEAAEWADTFINKYQDALDALSDK